MLQFRMVRITIRLYSLLLKRNHVDRRFQQGPIAEYDNRIYNGRLRDDEHQRSASPTQPMWKSDVPLTPYSADSKPARLTRDAC